MKLKISCVLGLATALFSLNTFAGIDHICSNLMTAYNDGSIPDLPDHESNNRTFDCQSLESSYFAISESGNGSDGERSSPMDHSCSVSKGILLKFQKTGPLMTLEVNSKVYLVVANDTANHLEILDTDGEVWGYARQESGSWGSTFLIQIMETSRYSHRDKPYVSGMLACSAVQGER